MNGIEHIESISSTKTRIVDVNLGSKCTHAALKSFYEISLVFHWYYASLCKHMANRYLLLEVRLLW